MDVNDKNWLVVTGTMESYDFSDLENFTIHQPDVAAEIKPLLTLGETSGKRKQEIMGVLPCFDHQTDWVQCGATQF